MGFHLVQIRQCLDLFLEEHAARDHEDLRIFLAQRGEPEVEEVFLLDGERRARLARSREEVLWSGEDGVERVRRFDIGAEVGNCSGDLLDLFLHRGEALVDGLLEFRFVEGGVGPKRDDDFGHGKFLVVGVAVGTAIARRRAMSGLGRTKIDRARAPARDGVATSGSRGHARSSASGFYIRFYIRFGMRIGSMTAMHARVRRVFCLSSVHSFE